MFVNVSQGALACSARRLKSVVRFKYHRSGDIIVHEMQAHNACRIMASSPSIIVFTNRIYSIQTRHISLQVSKHSVENCIKIGVQLFYGDLLHECNCPTWSHGDITRAHGKCCIKSYSYIHCKFTGALANIKRGVISTYKTTEKLKCRVKWNKLICPPTLYIRMQ